MTRDLGFPELLPGQRVAFRPSCPIHALGVRTGTITRYAIFRDFRAQRAQALETTAEDLLAAPADRLDERCPIVLVDVCRPVRYPAEFACMLEDLIPIAVDIPRNN